MAHQIPVTYILALSIAIQATAAVMAFRLIRITGRRTAWIFIAAALVLMAIRRVIPLYRLISGDVSIPPDPFNEIIGLVLSVSMAIGIALIGRLFGERRQEEQELGKQEEYIRRLVEYSPVAMVVSSGMDQQVILVSKKFTELFGYTIRDIPDVAQWWPLAYPDENYREEIKAQWSTKVAKAVSDRGEIEPMEATVRCKDGSRRHIEFHFSSIDARNIVTFVDLTERKKAERELEQLSRRNEMILNAAGEGMYGIDVNGNVAFVNPAAASILGYGAEEIVGKNSHSLFHQFRGDGSPYPSEMCPLHKSIISGEVHRAENEVFWGKNGGRIYIEGVTTPLVENNEIAGAVIVFRDITKRRKAEQALRDSEARLTEVQRIAHLGDWELDLKKYTLFWSDEVYRIFGLEPQKSGTTYEAFLDRVHPEDRDFVNRAYTESVRNRTGYDIEHRLLLETGEIKWVNERCNTEYDGIGTPVRSIGTVLDITERKKAENEILRLNTQLEQRVVRRTADMQKKSEELEESQRALMNIVEDLNLNTAELGRANLKLKELDRLKSMFIASMSHELRTPLNSIIGFSSIILEEWTGPLNEEQKKNLATVLRSGKHLLALINDVIDVSKIEAGKHEVGMEEFDLYGLVMDAVSLFRNEMKEKRLELIVEPPHLDMRTDRRRLLQCLVNLVGNAVKFTERGRIEISVNLVGSGEFAPEPDIVEIIVSDTGIGIKKEDVPKLFTAFTRLSSPLSMKVKGTGLGLYLVKKICTEILRGDVTVHSVPNEGSSFSLRIPMKL